MAQVLVHSHQHEQDIHLETDYASPNLILHWGLVGGKNYKGGWRLPGKGSRPEGTVQYKERALQTTFKSVPVYVSSLVNETKILRAGDGKRYVDIALRGDEVSDVLNFVLKDNASGRWSDNNGSNFSMELKAAKEKVTTIPDIPAVAPSSLRGEPFACRCVELVWHLGLSKMGSGRLPQSIHSNDFHKSDRECEMVMFH